MSGLNGATLQPLGVALGAEVCGIDVRTMNVDQFAELRGALRDHRLLAIRDQALDPQSLSEFAGGVGTREVYPFSEALPEDPFVVPIIKEPDDQEVFGGIWHTDSSYLAAPPSLTVLYAVELPVAGGDTLFADMQAVFDALSPGLREALVRLEGIYTAELVHSAAGEFAEAAGADRNRRQPGDLPATVTHPVVCAHPQTGRQSIFASLAHTERFAGFSREESLPLLEYLAAMVRRPEFQTRLTWQPGTVAIWDNRCVQHYPLNDYPGQRREMHRVIIAGRPPA